MASINPVVVDVSSDEDPDQRLDDFNWLTEVMEAVDGKSMKFDEVEVVSEVSVQTKTKYPRSISSAPAVEDDDNEDCVVLDGDPDKKTAVTTTTTTAVEGGDNAVDTDEVLVVGQKGEIACRDFPHPRHSCAKYPFNSISHEKYCDMCHCYVCEISAPCAYWCVGVSSIDHCHANDKETMWKSQREYFKTGKSSSSPTSSNPSSSSNSWARTHVGIRACSSSTVTTRFPNVRTNRRIRQSRTTLQNRGLQHRSTSLVQNDRCRPFIRKQRPRISETPQASEAEVISTLPASLMSEDRWHDVPSTMNLEMYTHQPIVTRYPCGNSAAGAEHEYNGSMFAAAGTQNLTAGSRPQGTGSENDLMQSKILSEFEEWLMDNPTAAAIGADEVAFTFDFETFLNK